MSAGFNREVVIVSPDGRMSGQDASKLNENMMKIWKKVFGNINFEDSGTDLKNKICTQYISFSGDGNFDLNNDLYVRFYIPPNTKKIVMGRFNAMLGRYRMDAGITSGGGKVVNVDISISSSSATAGGTVGGGGSTTGVNYWLDQSGNVNSAPSSIYWNDGVKVTGSKGTLELGSNGAVGSYVRKVSDTPAYIVDMSQLNHNHSYYHTHTFAGSPHSHSGSGKINLPDHTHGLKEGVQISKSAPAGVKINVNGMQVSSISGDNASVVNKNITDKLQIGAWNVITCTTTNLARIDLYGTIELISDY